MPEYLRFVCDFSRTNILTKKIFNFGAIGIFSGITIIMFGKSGDVIQFGTSLPFIPVGLCLMMVLKNTITRSFTQQYFRKVDLFRSVSVLALVFASFNDFLSLNGYINSNLWLPLGLVFGFGFFSLSVHEHIQETYLERDHLRENLENEVKIKTKELTEKTQSLEAAYSELRSAQAEVVNSAKLAGLGTMAAGIAEIQQSKWRVPNLLEKPLQQTKRSPTPMRPILKS